MKKKFENRENVDFVGDSKAVVASAEADRDAGGDGPDQDHLEHNQDHSQGPPPAQTDRKGTQNTAFYIVNKPADTNQGRTYICQSNYQGVVRYPLGSL